MPKSDSAQKLLKRLEKIQRAHGRLGDIHTRILAQAETLAELLNEAATFAGPSATRKAAGTKTATAKRTARKAGSAKRTTRKATSATPVTPAAKPASAPRSRRAAKPASATTRRRAPRRPVSA